MANMYFGKAGVGGLWSDAAKWWYDVARTSAALRTPIFGDDAYLDEVSGNCTVTVAAACDRLRETGTGYVDTLRFDSTLSFRVECHLDFSCTLVFGASGEVIYAATIAQGNIWPHATTSIKLGLESSISSIRVLNAQANGAYSHVRFALTSTGNLAFSTSVVRTFIDGYSVSESSTGRALISSSTTPSATAGLWIRTDFDTRDFIDRLDEMGHPGFGYDRDVTISLSSDLTQLVGQRWYFASHSTEDVTVAIATPDGQGHIKITNTGGLRFETTSTGNLLVDFSAATLRAPVSASDYLYRISSFRSNAAAKLVIDWGDNNEFAITTNLDVSNVTGMRGGDTTLNMLKLAPSGATRLIAGPNTVGGVDPDDWVLPFNIEILDVTATADVTFRNAIDIAGDVLIRPLASNGIDVTISDAVTFQERAEFRGNFEFENRGTGFLTISKDVNFRKELKVSDTELGSVNIIVNGGEMHVYGDLLVGVSTHISNSRSIVIHCQKNEDKLVQLDTEQDLTLGDWTFIQDDLTDGGGSYAMKFEVDKSSADDVVFSALQITNRVDAEMEVQFNDVSTAHEIVVTALTITGMGDVCVPVISDQYAVHLLGKVGGTVISPNNETVTLTKFTNIDATGGAIAATDWTCFDGGGNTNIDFVATGPSLGVCETELAFNATSYGAIPATQEVAIKNIGDGTMGQLAVDSIPSWLTVNIVGIGDAQKLQVRPSTTELSADVRTGFFHVLASGDTKRSPVRVNVTYTIIADVRVELSLSTLSFFTRQIDVFPVAQRVDAVNADTGETDVMEEIEVLNVPAWLDIEINPPSASSSSSPDSSSSSSPGQGFSDYQQLEASITAAGLVLPAGTYTANLRVTAANAAVDAILTVTYVIEYIAIEADPASLTFSMRETLSLPPDQAVVIGNPAGGTLGIVTVSGEPAWLDTLVTGVGEAQYIQFSINSSAQALAPGTYDVTLSLDAANATVTTQFPVSLKVTIRSFLLTPDALEFTPEDDWEVPGSRIVRAIRSDYSIIEPVTILDTPTWLSAVLDSSDLNNQIITVSVIQAAFDVLTDVDDYNVSLLITATGTGIESTLPLAVSVVTPAFFRRASCVMDFVPKIEGTLVEECDVPPPPPPLPVIPTPVPGGGGTFSIDGVVGILPCLTCTLEVTSGDEGGFSSPIMTLECTEHGCYPTSVEGTYCGGANNAVDEITLDECGHVCDVACEAPF